MDGVLVIDKPAGPTSFDVVSQVRAKLKVKKAGHTGTLDPMATGVLAICLGEATKLAGFITQGDKAYDAVIRLGSETDTQDAEGTESREAGFSEYGTRHRSAFRFVGSMETAVAFVMSQDGGVKALRQVGPQLLMWPYFNIGFVSALV